MLGARLLVEEGEDVAAVAIDTARRLGSTYVLMGPPAPRRGVKRFRESLITRLLEGLPGVDVRIVADPTLREDGRTAAGEGENLSGTERHSVKIAGAAQRLDT